MDSFKGFTRFLRVSYARTDRRSTFTQAKIHEFERSFPAAKEKIEGVIQLNMQEITRWIETPSSVMVRIEVYVGKWLNGEEEGDRV